MGLDVGTHAGQHAGIIQSWPLLAADTPALSALAQCLIEPRFQLNGTDGACEQLQRPYELQAKRASKKLQRAASVVVDASACASISDRLHAPLAQFQLHLRPHTSDHLVFLQVQSPDLLPMRGACSALPVCQAACSCDASLCVQQAASKSSQLCMKSTFSSMVLMLQAYAGVHA